MRSNFGELFGSRNLGFEIRKVRLKYCVSKLSGFGFLGLESLGFGSRTFASETLGYRIEWFETLLGLETRNPRPRTSSFWVSNPISRDPALKP